MSELDEILTRWVLGMTMRMVNNVYLNSEPDEFEDFLEKYDKQKHKFEPDMNRCDGCNGVEIATQEISNLLKEQKLQLLKEVMKCLGADETKPASGANREMINLEWRSRQVRNQLRATQRIALDKLFNVRGRND